MGCGFRRARPSNARSRPEVYFDCRAALLDTAPVAPAAVRSHQDAQSQHSPGELKKKPTWSQAKSNVSNGVAFWKCASIRVRAASRVFQPFQRPCDCFASGSVGN